MKPIGKPKMGIFDFTDCEGCEVELINLKDQLVDLLEGVEIVNWRLAKEGNKPGPFDVAIIEGTPVTPHEQDLLREIREKTRIIVALGACACTGGIPAIIDDERDRLSFYKSAYPPEYKPRGTEAKPLSAYVEVDYMINGCPVDKREIARTLSSLLRGCAPEERDYPVCMECKINDNRCRLVNGEPCLGPITMGGCRAFCITHGKHCYGCYGLVKDANFDRMVTALEEIAGRGDAERMLGMFMSESEEYKRRYGRR
ncbi:MAG: NADH:ubiquinone oxidoreductase [Candidatus Altiarchaeales archaeon]|nr:NADH:ubiquinone oxidoreductase [Candidatus Altiarchaeales archaeon]MBD3416024.1 NADH:ubiquinone oxidoreductase [Candidatus Altiarchaeales archaeon]